MEQTLSLEVSLHTVIALGFYFAAFIYIIFTTIMYYHWNEYSIDAGVTRITLVLYFLITIPLMLTLGVLALII
jgi:hypothetical protein